MTEEEAKTKWCPFARVGGETSGLGSLNRDGAKGPIEQARCIASACMAWRKEAAPSGIERIRAHRAEHNSTLAVAVAAVKAEDVIVGGFCGLAGRP